MAVGNRSTSRAAAKPAASKSVASKSVASKQANGEHNESLNGIGETAGAVWRYLDANGPATLAQLVKDVKAPRDLVMQALGWLAREDKIEFDHSKTKRVSLRPAGE